MNRLADFSASFRGWAAIVVGRPDAAAQFRATRGGLIVALLTLLVAFLLSIAAQSAALGPPGPLQLISGLVIQAVTMGVLYFAVTQMVRIVRLEVAPLVLYVPIVYAVAYLFVVSIPLALIGPNAGLVAMAILGCLIGRAGAVLGGMRLPVAIAFALLCVIVLVVVPNALYMLASLVPTA